MPAQEAARWTPVLAAALLATAATAAAAAPMGRSTAQAFFVSQDARGCVTTEVSVFARGNPGRAKLNLTFSKVDECEDKVLLSAQTKVNLTDGALSVRPDLGGAALTATVPVVDKVSGEELAATIRVTWTAVEPAITADTLVEEDEPGRFTRQRARRSLRPAQATSLLTVAGVDLTPLPATDASLRLVQGAGPGTRR